MGVKIEAPNSKYHGTTAGIDFAGGVAEVAEMEPGLQDWFRRHGYTVSGEDATDQPDDLSVPETPPTADELEDHTRDKLNELAGDAGVEDADDKSKFPTKADVAQAIVDAREAG